MERIGLEPGTEIGGYRLLSALGSGAMGTVYRAVDGGGSTVAFKLLHPNLTADAEMRQRLGREVAALQRVDHPGVAQVLDAEADSAEMFIVTELVDGPTLDAEVARGGPLDADDLVELADQLRGALSAVHAAGVIHRDLKPSNVLIADTGPVLIDFGIAHGMEDARVTSTGFVMGTPGYLAPELVDRQDPSPATDWWSWAALLVYAATGRSPFGVRPLQAVITRARMGDPDTAGLGPRTAAALRGALVGDPQERLSPSEVVEQLRIAAEDGDVPTAVLPRGATAVLPVGAATSVLPPLGAASPYGDDAGSTRPVDLVKAAEPDRTAVLERAPAYPAVPPRDYGASPSTQDIPLTPDHPTGPSTDPYDRPHAGPYPGPDPEPGYRRPPLRRRAVAVLAIAATTVLAGATYPGAAIVVLVVLTLLSRFVGLCHDAFHSRREEQGPRRSDGAWAAATLPWRAVWTVLSSVPSVLVAASAVVVVGGVLWWALGTERLVVGSSGDSGASDPFAYSVVLLLAVALAALLLWFGPATHPVRHGARVVLNRLAPTWVGTLVVVVAAATLGAYLLSLVLSGHPVEWSPLQEPPRFTP